MAAAHGLMAPGVRVKRHLPDIMIDKTIDSC